MIKITVSLLLAVIIVIPNLIGQAQRYKNNLCNEIS